MKFIHFLITVFTCILVLYGCSSAPSPDYHPKTLKLYENDVKGRPPYITQSSNREEIPILEWEALTTEKKSILGEWEGISFEGNNVNYFFKSNGKCDWTVADRKIKGRYKIEEEEKLYRITMTDFNTKHLKGIAFYGIFKLKGEEMLFYGVTVQDRKDLYELPDSFPGNSLLLRKKQSDS